jgi:hypothetical protein
MHCHTPQVPYFGVRENSWGLERRGDRWNVTYDL